MSAIKVRLVAALIMLVLACDLAWAIGIAPSRSIMRLGPGESTSQKFRLINTEGSAKNVSVLVLGILKDNIQMDSNFEFAENETEKTAHMQITIPEDFELAGMHGVDIIFKEEAPAQRRRQPTNVGLVAIKSRLEIYIPYAKKYLDFELMLSAPEILYADSIGITIPVHNLGSEDVTGCKANIRVTDPRNITSYDYETESISVAAGTDTKFPTIWVSGVIVGRHILDVTVSYDGKTKHMNATYMVDENPKYDMSKMLPKNTLDVMFSEAEKEPTLEAPTPVRWNRLLILLSSLFVMLVVSFEAVWIVSFYGLRRKK